MKTKKDYIFFDFDGTLVDTGPGIMNATHYALLKYGINEENSEILRLFVGPPLIDSFGKYYGFSYEKACDAVIKFREYYLVKGKTECDIYPRVIEMLDKLKKAGKHLAVATGKPEDLAHRIAGQFGLTDYFDTIHGSYVDEEGEHRTDKTEIINLIRDELNISDPDSCIMVGDRANDIQGAHGAGIKAIGSLWGYGSPEELNGAGAEYTAKAPLDIADMIINDLL